MNVAQDIPLPGADPVGEVGVVDVLVATVSVPTATHLALAATRKAATSKGISSLKLDSDPLGSLLN
jgi:hypothetical protein